MIAYQNEPSAQDSLTIKQIKWLLDRHHVGYKYIDNQLMMSDDYINSEGETVLEWTKPIRTYGKLMKWLGY